ncbi:hypothetical protein DL93DRAFT_2099545 [Clavulina sp. PMI_390]|nr:hypothetical protein DL93DRAFT_2099545 [Clavulina sp. PMI_390]
MSFDLVVVGCGGGPSELNLSSYFVKARENSWAQGILALEAGSGLGALKEILVDHPLVFEDEGARVPITGGGGSASKRAASIYSCIRTFLVSHAHFDHVAGLVIGAGSTTSTLRRFVVALPTVIHDLQTVFDGQKLWPRLVLQSTEPALPFCYTYHPIPPHSPYTTIAPSLSARLLPITHGMITPFSSPSDSQSQPPSHSHSHQAKPQSISYDSTAFFIRNDTTQQEFLFFGDVEPDSISSFPRNRAVWEEAAALIISPIPRWPTTFGGAPPSPAGSLPRLSHIFLECSYPNGRRKEELFGHLSPPHVRDEMRVLACEVVKARKTLNNTVRRTSMGVIPSGSALSPPFRSFSTAGQVNGNGVHATNGVSTTNGVAAGGGMGAAVGALFNRARRRRQSTITSASVPSLLSTASSSQTTYTPDSDSPLSMNGNGTFSPSSPVSCAPSSMPMPLADADLVGALEGMTLVIIHCKEPVDDTGANPDGGGEVDIRTIIRDEVEQLLKPLRLGIRVVVARQGMRMTFLYLRRLSQTSNAIYHPQLPSPP